MISFGEGVLYAGLFLLGVGFLSAGLYLRWRSAVSRHWPTVPGTIVRARAREQVDTREGGGVITRYYPEVEYAYTVAGHTYRSTRIRFGGLPFSLTPDRDEVITWLKEHYPEGKNVTVHYNPRRPQEAVLEPGVATAAYLLIGIGVISLVGGVLVGM